MFRLELGSFSPSRLNFHIQAQFSQQAQSTHPGSISTSLTLKCVILFLFDFLKSSRLGKKDSHFGLVYGKVYPKISSISKNIHFYIIPRTREWKFSGAQFPHPMCGNWAARIKRDSHSHLKSKFFICHTKI